MKLSVIGAQLAQGMRVGAISRADVADFMLDETELSRYLGHCPALTN